VHRGQPSSWQRLNVFAGVAQGPKHEAIRRFDRISNISAAPKFAASANLATSAALA
jgi:hypothetical protein